MELAEWRQPAAHTEHGIRHEDSALLLATCQGALDGRDVPVRNDDDPRAGQQAGVDDRRVVRAVAHHESPGAGQCRQCGQVGEVAGKEHERRRRADVRSQRLLQRHV